MKAPAGLTAFIETVQHNCHISDARDHGIYTMCTMVLKLRNLYKWEKGLEPWQEPEAADLLNWIEAKENYWATLAEEQFGVLPVAGKVLEPLDLEVINDHLADEKVLYGAGFGRSMKAVFFLAEIVERRSIQGCPAVILGREWAREMASPFAMVQDGLILLRREPLRYFLWDQIQEVRSSCRSSMHHALQPYGVFRDGNIDRKLLQAALDTIVVGEIDLFLYHEAGEILQTTLDSQALRAIIDHFPGTVLEFVSRAVKDVLADTHPNGLLAFIIGAQRKSSLGFYLTFLDGLRQKLFPEITAAWQLFLGDGNWSHIERARRSCWTRNQEVAGHIQDVSQAIGREPDDHLLRRFNAYVLEPLGLEKPRGR